MASSFPGAIDSFTNPSGSDQLTSPDHALQHANINDAAEAIETKLGVGASTPAANEGLFGTGAGTSDWSQTWTGGSLDDATILNSYLGLVEIEGGTLRLGTVTESIVGTNQIEGGTINMGAGTLSNLLYIGGTANGITLGTPIIGTVSIPGTTNPLSFSAAIAPGVGTITDAGTMTINAQQAQIFYSVLGTSAGNRLINNPLNMVSGQLLSLAIQASGSANGTLTFGTIFRFASGGTPTLGTASTWNYMGFRKNLVDGRLDFIGSSLGLI